MKKKLICLVLAIVFVISLTSCFKGDIKYNYKSMSKYITLADYRNFIAEIDMATIQATIDSYIVDNAKAYTLKEGDVIKIKLSNVCKIVWIEDENKKDKDGNPLKVDSKGDKIEELNKEFTIVLGENKFSKKLEKDSFEENVIGSTLDEEWNTTCILSDEFEMEEYRGEEIYFEAEIVSIERELQPGDIVDVEYKGYHIEVDEDGNPKTDEDGKIIIKQEKNDKDEMVDKIFNEGETQSFIGSHMAIDDFENGLIGMKFGETKRFPATFPEDYNRDDNDGESLNGKTVVFECKITNIYVTPIYNDEFVKNNIKEYENTEEFEKALFETAVRNAISENLVQNSVIHSYPRSEYKVAKSQLDSDLKNLQPYGISYEQYLLWFMGMTPDEYLEYTLNFEMIYYAVANENDMAPTKEQVNKAREAYVENLIQNYMISYGYTRAQAENVASVYMDTQVSPYYFYDQELFAMVDDYLYEITESKQKPIEEGKESISRKMAEEDKAKQEAEKDKDAKGE